ncbi:MAG: cell division/cell wall cluster transcriptional repressor MraZ [Deltaproteobacteria bacterium]|jgi:MraZ protein|nr:cell division/cell wall cluster transcriptional repressor MraZ [Deltaproteobacteria bacterium]
MVQGASINFFSEARHTLDEKGRLTLPGFVRDVLARSSAPEQLWLGWMPGDACLNAYPKETMAELEAEWADPSRFASTAQHSDFQRLFRSRLETVTTDKAGRILLPPSKRELAGITKDVVVNGNGDKFEIWEPARYQEKMDKVAQAYVAAAQGADPAAPRYPRC